MVERPFWIARIESAWKEAPISWLSGGRRSGKTTLARSLDADRTHYVNCDLPAAEDMVRDPSLFYRNCPGASLSSTRSINCVTPAVY